MNRHSDISKSECIAKIKEIIPDIEDDLINKLYDSARKGKEIERCGSLINWVEKVEHGIIMLDNNDYFTALMRSLPISLNLAATDYGTTRQRDLGQLWTDTARGFLGEIALSKFALRHFNIQLELDYSIDGALEDYLPSDIGKIYLPNKDKTIDPQIRVSFKTTKFSGIWLDIPGAQIHHSDAFVLVKLGITRDHFIAFLKAMSFIKDKLLHKGIKDGAINKDYADQLWESLPDFRPIPAYVVGYLDRNIINNPSEVEYKESRKRDGSFKHYTITNYVGRVENRKPVEAPESLKSYECMFESINSFSQADRFVANAGSLKYTKSDWNELFTQVTGGEI